MGVDRQGIAGGSENGGSKKGGADPYRLRYHLMPPQGWMNDPNGLCRYRGSYHVFFQYSPEDVNGGEKYWGHYTSKDLLSWEFHGAPLAPDSAYDRDGVYSGSAFIEEGRMYLFYTGNVKEVGEHDYIHSGRQANTMLVESDDGFHFGTKQCLMTNEDYPPYYTCHIRDPKVWKQGAYYYMVQGGRIGEGRDKGAALVFVSEDLHRWKVLREISVEEPFGYMWECPDYYRLGGQGILSVSPQGLDAEEYRYQNIYQAGYFLVEGMPEQVTGEVRLHDFREWDMGFDFYAPQTFEDDDGRRLLIGWAGMPDAEYDNMPAARMGWQHALTVPRELVYQDGRILQRPAAELKALRREKQEFREDDIVYVPEGDRAFELWIDDISSAEFTACFAAPGMSGLRLSYGKGVFRMAFYGEQAEAAGRGRRERKIRMDTLNNIRLLVDASLIEVYLNDGEYVMTTRYYMPEEVLELSVHCQNSRKVIWKIAGMTWQDMT